MKTSVIKRLPLLSGVAIIAIVVNHAASWGHYAMFLWADRYRPVSVPNWDQIGSIPYYVLMVLKQLPVFSVPAFIFISGFFIAYSVRGNQRTVSYKLVRNRLVYLIIPYLIWSITIFARDSLFRGEKNPPLWYLSTLLIGKADGIYYFVPLLCLFYLLSPLLVSLAKFNYKRLLIISFLIQFGAVILNSLHYLEYLNLVAGKIPLLDQLWIYVPSFSPVWHLFYFVLGIGLGLYFRAFMEVLNQFKAVVFIALPITAILNIVESDILLRVSLSNWGAYLGTLSFHLYAITFIFSFLLAEAIPNSKMLLYPSNKTYGIFLIHVIVIGTASSIIISFLPGILAHLLIFVPLLFVLGLAVPLFMMESVTRSPVRRYYRYLFG
jgi:hypothetical protein